MPALRSLAFSTKAAAVVASLALMVSGSSAQQDAGRKPLPDAPTNQSVMENYVVPRSVLTVTGPYKSRGVPQVNLRNSPRLDSLIKDGVIMLSMSDAITIALQDNLDIDIARYNLPIADTDILRTKGGGQPLGVATGVVSGTPGGTGTGVAGGALTSTGSSAGGTTAGTGGAGAGTSGLVLSSLGAGPAAPQFDPSVIGNLQIQRAIYPQASASAGQLAISQNTSTANFTYSQGFATGTNLGATFNNTRLTTNSLFASFVPELASSFQLTLTQHLLQGRGWAINNRFITISKNNRAITDASFRQQIISTVAQIQDIYWDLVSAFEDLRVKRETMAFAERTLSDNKKQLQIGTLAPIDVTNAESQVATARQNIIVSETNLQLQQLYTLNALSRKIGASQMSFAPIVPTDTMVIPLAEAVEPTQDLIAEALVKNPTLAQARIDLKNRQLNAKAAANGLLPTLDLVGFYGGSSLAGTFNSNLCTLPSSFVAALCPPLAPIPSPTGYGTAFTNLFNSTAPDKGVALNLTIPIRNRQAQSVQVRSELEIRQAQVRLQQLENQVIIAVRNAQFALQQNKARVDAAVEAERYARENLLAEQKKYKFGASTSYLVFQQETNLATAEENLLAAKIAYAKSHVNFDQVMSRTLQRNGILLADAETGRISSLPLTPDAAPTKNLPTPVSPEIPPKGTSTQPLLNQPNYPGPGESSQPTTPSPQR
ncbi:MAG: TolC family protein [Candidatus Korobacteraceae bacterium]